MPAGSDAVVMIEHTTHDASSFTTDRELKSGDNFNPQGREAHSGQLVIPAGVRGGHPEVALAATYGMANLKVFVQPTVAILATGDEIVSIESTPLSHQIRNSNTWSLFAQVASAGGVPVPLRSRKTIWNRRERLSLGDSNRICCCSPAASRRASTIWSSRCFLNLARNFILIASSSNPANRWCLARLRSMGCECSSSDCRAIRHRP